MSIKKFELTTDTKIFFGRKLFRIKALISFGDVKAGDLGGFIEKESNISHDGNAWVYGDARVYGDADYVCIKGLGSYNRNTTFFKCKDGHIHVSCGCFSGTLSEFEAKVKETHGGSKYAREYLVALEVVKIHFEKETENEID